MCLFIHLLFICSLLSLLLLLLLLLLILREDAVERPGRGAHDPRGAGLRGHIMVNHTIIDNKQAIILYNIV